MRKLLNLTKELIRRPSVTPDDQGCQDLIIEHLEVLGFQPEKLRYDLVDNLWARRGKTDPLFIFAGHTDVVPPGPLDDWQSGPFAPEIREGLLYGRGAADMKSSIAAMLVATEMFIHQHPDHKGSIGFLITSDEEGDAINGTRRVIEHLQARQEKIHWCLVGEPSSQAMLGDTIKIGRRGSLSGELIVHGHQGHIAYPHLADNPIHRAAQAIAELCAIQWDQGNENFPPTSFQISNLNAGTGATNVIPGRLTAKFNFRYSTETSHGQLRASIESILKKHSLDFRIHWTLFGEPFLTESGELINTCISAIQEELGIQTTLSTAGGTSDGRFIAKTGAQIVELGPINASIHKINEHVRVVDIEKLASVYLSILKKLLV